MDRLDTKEAVGISKRCLDYILEVTPTRGRPGADLRAAIGAFEAEAETLIRNDKSGQPLSDIFGLAKTASVTVSQLAFVRSTVSVEQALTIGGLLMKNSLIYFSLATEAAIVASMKFVNRDDVDSMIRRMNEGFSPMEEVAADDMVQMIYQKLVSTHAAVIFYLIQTSRPLPRMINFRFNDAQPTLYFAYRLYADAARADELRAENRVVHPAFARPMGRGMST